MIIRELRLKDFPYRSRKGLSERLVKGYLAKKGYEVFRGSMALGVEYSVNYHLYENVKRKYDRLEAILQRRLGARLEDFRKSLGSGIPDFFVHNRTESFFVEAKLEHEQVRKGQLSRIRLMEKFGFMVVVVRIKRHVYRHIMEMDLEKNEKSVKMRQKRFRR